MKVAAWIGLLFVAALFALAMSTIDSPVPPDVRLNTVELAGWRDRAHTAEALLDACRQRVLRCPTDDDTGAGD